ncbi:MAG TPA: hypothetical protein DCF33_15925 [Saprospirales bacterium]|nr:hypothetical protein [Saprospirales bacterium]
MLFFSSFTLRTSIEGISLGIKCGFTFQDFAQGKCRAPTHHGVFMNDIDQQMRHGLILWILK